MDAASFDVPRYLSLLPLFAELPAPELNRLADSCQARRLARGDTVFRAGQRCDEFHLVVTGRIKLFALSSAGQEKVIELVGPGSSFAEALMFSDAPCTISAQALTDTLVLGFGKAAVRDLIDRDPAFAMRLLSGMSRQMLGLIHDVQSHALSSGLERVVDFLLRTPSSQAAAACGAITVSLPASKATVASRLSLTPEYFSRVLRELETSGLIAVERRNIRIRDTAALAGYAMA